MTKKFNYKLPSMVALTLFELPSLLTTHTPQKNTKIKQTIKRIG